MLQFRNHEEEKKNILVILVSFSMDLLVLSVGGRVSNPVCQNMGQLLRHINKQSGSLGSQSFKNKSQAVYFLWSDLPPDTVSLLSPVLLLTLQ